MENVEFLIKVLEKQYELAGVKKSITEILEMDEETQSNYLSKYKISQEQYQELKDYFFEVSSENEDFKDLDLLENKTEILNSIFESLMENYGFPIKKKCGRKKKIE